MTWLFWYLNFVLYLIIGTDNKRFMKQRSISAIQLLQALVQVNCDNNSTPSTRAYTVIAIPLLLIMLTTITYMLHFKLPCDFFIHFQVAD